MLGALGGVGSGEWRVGRRTAGRRASAAGAGSRSAVLQEMRGGAGSEFTEFIQRGIDRQARAPQVGWVGGWRVCVCVCLSTYSKPNLGSWEEEKWCLRASFLSSSRGSLERRVKMMMVVVDVMKKKKMMISCVSWQTGLARSC